MTHEEQLQKWVDGESIHGAGKHEDCCPDFSCCNPKLLAFKGERQAFQAADEQARHAMLFTFLGRMLAIEGANAYIAGDPANDEREQ